MTHSLSRANCKPKTGQHFFVGDVEYEMAGKIGDGAAGLVRRAKRVAGGSAVAVKFLAPDPKYIEESAFDDVAARFRREGQRGAKLDHENLIEIHDYCENENGTAFPNGAIRNPFLAMELAGGRSLERYIRRIDESARGTFVVDQERLAIAVQIARALSFLHSRKIVHRDVKPANIFLSNSPRLGNPIRAKLGDFGVVKWGDFHASVATGTLTVSSQQGLGTLKYMAPEQAIAPKDVTVRSDIYSLGITLFELFSGAILASPHHVFSIMTARLSRGNTISRFLQLDLKLQFEDADLGEIILDMHLRGAQSRPPIKRILGRLEWEYERRFGAKLPSH